MKRLGTGAVLALALSGFATAGCSGGLDEAPQSTAAQGEMGLGATGPEVEKAQAYLRAYGYLPNAELAQQYPSWRPLVTQAPARADVIDENMQEALAHLQKNLGLPATGTLDERTLTAMQQPRCGVPDGDLAAAPRTEKFAVGEAGNRWTKTNITFRYVSTGGLGSLAQAQARALISGGIKAWQTNTNLTFTEVTTGGDFLVTFRNVDGAGNILAIGAAPPSPGLQFDTSEAWTGASLLAVAIHETGHLIGLNHSSFGSDALGYPIMHPINHNVTTFTDDDIIGANAVYNGWELMPGAAIDIGVNSITGGTADIVWVLGTDKVPYQWNGTGWVQEPGITGNRLDVDSQGHAVVVGTDQRVYRHQSFNPKWAELPGGGLAKDVAVGQNGAIWAIGLDNLAWNFSSGSGSWSAMGGPANQVAIDVTPNGQPYVVTSNNQLWVRGSTWVQVRTGVGSDVGIGGKLNGPGTRDWVFVLGSNAVPFLQDSQPGLSFTFPCGATTCTTTAPATNTWLSMGGTASRIAAGARGRSWLVNSANQIFRRLEMP